MEDGTRTGVEPQHAEISNNFVATWLFAMRFGALEELLK